MPNAKSKVAIMAPDGSGGLPKVQDRQVRIVMNPTERTFLALEM